MRKVNSIIYSISYVNLYMRIYATKFINKKGKRSLRNEKGGRKRWRTDLRRMRKMMNEDKMD